MHIAAQELIAQWGYLAVCIGTFVEGEGVLLAAGALAHRGLLSWPLVALCALLGSISWSQLWFRVGRHAGHFGLQARPNWAARVARCEHWLTRYASLFVVGFRFVAGMGSVSPALLGATGYPLGRFTRLDSAGAALWVAAVGSVGWGLGAGLQRILGWS